MVITLNSRHVTDLDKLRAAAASVMTNSFYMDAAGRVLVADRAAVINTNLRLRGWSGLSHMDGHDYCTLGFTVAQAEYIGGAHRTGRYCEVVVKCATPWRFEQVGGAWCLTGAGEYLDGAYLDIWTAQRALREVWHG